MGATIPASQIGDAKGSSPNLIDSLTEIILQTGLDTNEVIDRLQNAIDGGAAQIMGSEDKPTQKKAKHSDAAGNSTDLFCPDPAIWSITGTSTASQLAPLRNEKNPSRNSYPGIGRGYKAPWIQEISPPNSVSSSSSWPFDSPDRQPKLPISLGGLLNPISFTRGAFHQGDQIVAPGLTNSSSGSSLSSNQSWSHSPVKPYDGQTNSGPKTTPMRQISPPAYNNPLFVESVGISNPRQYGYQSPISPPNKNPQPFGAPGSATTLKHDQPHQGFRPMQAVLEPSNRQVHARSMSLNCSGMSPNDESPTKFSERYFGMHTEGNASAEHIADHENCALWLRNLPPNVTYKELLDSIRGVGRIWCTFINTPDFVTHSTAAAKVVFFSPDSAQRYLSYIETMLPTIRGFRIKADHNRIKYAQKPVVGSASRVLIITGESWFVNPASLVTFFQDKFVFQVDEIIELVQTGGRAVVEFRFGSYRCQAQMGKMALDRINPGGFERADFGDDPCEKGDTWSSYRIATQRIQDSP